MEKLIIILLFMGFGLGMMIDIGFKYLIVTPAKHEFLLICHQGNYSELETILDRGCYYFDYPACLDNLIERRQIDMINLVREKCLSNHS